MSSDFGDDSGEKLFDNLLRIGERMGEDAMARHADKLHSAFENAKKGATRGKSDEDACVEWAKLDMHEFQELEGYEEIKGAIESKLKSHGVEPTWFDDRAKGKEYLLFRIADAHQVWESLDELSCETEDARSRASEQLKKDVEIVRDSRTLEEKAKDARETSKALEDGAGKSRRRSIGPRRQQTRTR